MMLNVLLLGFLGAPFLMGLLLVSIFRRLHPPVAYWITVATTGLSALSVLALLPYAGQDVSLNLTWIPSTGSMSLSLGATSLYAALVTTGCACLALLGSSLNNRAASSWWKGIWLVALAASNVAFVSGHFLGRYVALEVVGMCIALAPLVELRGVDGPWLAKMVYVILRIGDAGMLMAILLLMNATNTLDITPALDGGAAMGREPLLWAVGGFLLAVWVKVGGWPFILWIYPGRKLSLPSLSWLYATVMPNLGVYLLYRVTPLLSLADPLPEIILWVSAGAAVLAMINVLVYKDLRTIVIPWGSALGSLALFAAAAGERYIVWLCLLVVTPLRLLLFLASDLVERAETISQRRFAAALMGIAGGLLVGFGMLVSWWMQDLDVPQGALWLLQGSVALMGVRTFYLMLHLFRASPLQELERVFSWTRGAVASFLGLLTLVGGMGLRPLSIYLFEVNHIHLPDIPTGLTLLRYIVLSPAVWGTVVVAIAIRELSRQTLLLDMEGTEAENQSEAPLLQALYSVRRVIEVDALDRAVRTSQFLLKAVRLFSRIVEQDGLEGLLRAVVRAVKRLGEEIQGWHTGRLRYNLLWVLLTLVLALSMVMWVG